MVGNEASVSPGSKDHRCPLYILYLSPIHSPSAYTWVPLYSATHHNVGEGIRPFMSSYPAPHVNIINELKYP